MYLIPERCALRIKPENTSFTSLPKIIHYYYYYP